MLCMEMLLSVHVCMANMRHMGEGLHLNYCEWGKCAMYQHPPLWLTCYMLKSSQSGLGYRRLQNRHAKQFIIMEATDQRKDMKNVGTL